MDLSRKYTIKCPACSAEYADDGYILDCPEEHNPALLLTDFGNAPFVCDPHAEGIYRYRNWLPVQHVIAGVGRAAVYQSPQLNRIIGLPHLWIAFNGYWPEREAFLETGTFKELEAYTVLSRLPRAFKDVLIVASAGNTAAAFAHICSQNRLPCLIILPESGLPGMQFRYELDPCVKLIALTGFVDYSDAINLANRFTKQKGFFLEGGVKNVGRRAGLGTTLLHAIESIGEVPDYYFQAIGSGAGGIGVFEMARKLTRDGRFGHKLPRLMLSQNLPFAPIYFSWKKRQRELLQCNRDEGKRQIQQIAAQVLSNQQPPYSIQGGVFDVLTGSGGDMLAATNQEAHYAVRLFEEIEGIDIDPAAGVALATLIKAIDAGQIERSALVLLNITGGGWKRRMLSGKLLPAQPARRIVAQEMQARESIEKIVALFH